MTYQVLARKYRPQVYSEVIGQDVSVRILKNSIKMNRIPSGLLISGTRGTGKTTLARIYAKSINCQNCEPGEDPCRSCASCIDAENDAHPDIIEFDAASNNGVDFVRDLSDYVIRLKTYNRRIFIFDEVHMFTAQAQAAFLKLLEEPPVDVTFILVTTDPERLLRTIRSRCMSMPLGSVNTKDIELSIRTILNKEGVNYTDNFIKDLSLLGDGSLRDVQQYLDQMILSAGGEKLDSELLSIMFGIVSVSVYKELAGMLCSWNLKNGLKLLEKWYQHGVDIKKVYLDGIPNLIRDMTLYLNGFDGENPPFISGIPVEVFKSKMTLNLEHLKFLTELWRRFEDIMDNTDFPKIIFTMFLATAFGDSK